MVGIAVTGGGAMVGAVASSVFSITSARRLSVEFSALEIITGLSSLVLLFNDRLERVSLADLLSYLRFRLLPLAASLSDSREFIDPIDILRSRCWLKIVGRNVGGREEEGGGLVPTDTEVVDSEKLGFSGRRAELLPDDAMVGVAPDGMP